MTENKNSELDYIKERTEKAAELLEERYHERFDILDYLGQPSMKEYYEVKAASAENPGVVFHAAIDADYAGFSDSYAAKMASRKFSDTIAKNLDAVKGYVYIYSEPMIRDLPLESADVSVSELAEFPGARIMTVRVFICTEEKSAENIYASYVKMFDSLKAFSGNLYVYLTDEETLRNIQRYVESNITLYRDFFEMADKALVISDKYDKGVPQITKETFMEKMGNCL